GKTLDQPQVALAVRPKISINRAANLNNSSNLECHPVFGKMLLRFRKEALMVKAAANLNNSNSSSPECRPLAVRGPVLTAKGAENTKRKARMRHRQPVVDKCQLELDSSRAR